MNRELIEALAVTAELTGTTLSEPAARVLAEELGAYPLPMVLSALRRCRRELRGRLTFEAIASRLEDGHPGPEEAWAMVPRDEEATVVWTDEIAAAWGIARPLLLEGDRVAARMAFTEHYRTLIAKARDERRAPRWAVSLGHDAQGREAALLEAASKGRITAEHAASLIPHRPHADVLAFVHARLAAYPAVSGSRRAVEGVAS